MSKYLNKTFTVPIGSKLTALEYDLRVGKITQREYEKAILINAKKETR